MKLVNEWRTACLVARNLGYDPDQMGAATLSKAGYFDGNGIKHPWRDPQHWVAIYEAMLKDTQLVVLGKRVVSDDPVNHPKHYTSDPSGVECITITRHRSFNVGNALKYLWRAGLKSDAGREPREKQIEDLEKAIWYLNDEIGLLRGAA